MRSSASRGLVGSGPFDPITLFFIGNREAQYPLNSGGTLLLWRNVLFMHLERSANALADRIRCNPTMRPT